MSTADEHMAEMEAAESDLFRDRLQTLSEWIDEANDGVDLIAQTWGRLAKTSEEVGEVIEAWIGVIGQNPRKGVTHTRNDVSKELLDVAVTALAADEHMHNNDGGSYDRLLMHLLRLCERAGLSSPAVSENGTDHV